MKKFAKVMAFMLCAALLVCGGIFGTLAYLTSTTDTVTNTFTFGSVSITLTESKVGADGKPVEGAARVTENEFHLIPGAEYTKDPTIFVGSTSEDCWIFVQVKNGIKGIEGATTIESQMSANWTLVTGTTDVYAYKAVVSKNDVIPVFTKVTISGDVVDFDDYANATITVKGFAVQANGFATAEAAWTAAGFTLN